MSLCFILDHASSPKKKKKEEPHPILPCQLCGMFMNSPSQYEQVILISNFL